MDLQPVFRKPEIPALTDGRSKNFPLYQFDKDVLCVIVRFLDIDSWKSFAKVCKRFYLIAKVEQYKRNQFRGFNVRNKIVMIRSTRTLKNFLHSYHFVIVKKEPSFFLALRRSDISEKELSSFDSHSKIEEMIQMLKGDKLLILQVVNPLAKNLTRIFKMTYL